MRLRRSSTQDQLRDRVPNRRRLRGRVAIDEARKRIPGAEPGPAQRAGASGRKAAVAVSGAVRRGAAAARDAGRGAVERLDPSRSRQRASRRRKIGTAAGAGAAGIAGAFFLDPRSGKRRRHIARDRGAALLRRATGVTRRQASYRGGQPAGAAKQAAGRAAPAEPDVSDQELTEKVKSELFRPAEAPMESVNVNVENGVVYLRGEVKRPEQVSDLVEGARTIEGVRGVESFLHTAGTPAPMKENGKGAGSRRTTAS